MKLATCLLFALSLFGATYEVGPGKPYADPLNLPWTQLADGDSIKLYYRPEPYRNLIYIGWSNFSLSCIPGPNGERPVLDGDGAVGIASKLDYFNWSRGIVRVGQSSSPPSRLLENVTIEGCEIRNAWRANGNKGFRRDLNPTGPYTPWDDNSAAVQATGVRNIVIRNNYIHSSKIGVAVFSGYPSFVSENCQIRDNQFADLGGVGDSQSHVTYSECNQELIQGNYSKQQPGWSSVYKSRGVGTKIYGNFIDGGDAAADFVDSAQMRARFGNESHDVFANNVVIKYSDYENDRYIHFGGDSGDHSGYRRNILYILNNTIYSVRNMGNVLVRASTWEQRVILLNNVIQWAGMWRYGFYLGLANPAWRTGPDGQRARIEYGANWIQRGSCPDPSIANYLCGLPGDLDLTDLGGNRWVKSSGAENSPPSTSPLWDSNFHPNPESPLVDGGVMPELAGIDWTFGGTRTIVGKAIDIGAFEAGTSDRPGIQTGGGFVITPPPTTTTTTTIPPASTTTSNNVPASTPPVTSFEQSIAALKGLVDKAATAKKVASDAAAAAAAAITEAKAAAARAEYDVTSAGEQYVQQIRKVLEDAGLK